jgi:hypothetical protein
MKNILLILLTLSALVDGEEAVDAKDPYLKLLEGSFTSSAKITKAVSESGWYINKKVSVNNEKFIVIWMSMKEALVVNKSYVFVRKNGTYQNWVNFSSNVVLECNPDGSVTFKVKHLGSEDLEKISTCRGPF